MQRYASVRRRLGKETKEERKTRKGMNKNTKQKMKTNLKHKNEITCLQVLMRTGRIMQEEDEKEKGVIKIGESETEKKKSRKGMKAKIIECKRKRRIIQAEVKKKREL
jgi:hypothetical protein